MHGVWEELDYTEQCQHVKETAAEMRTVCEALVAAAVGAMRVCRVV